MFKELLDNRDLAYFTVDPAEFDLFNVSTAEHAVPFTATLMHVPKLATSAFTSDLTSRDDVVLAFLSLFLLLIIEGIVATVLLRSRDGRMSNFSFSVKLLIELVRDFSFRKIFKSGNAEREERMKRKPNWRLIALAVLVLVATFGLEILVLFMTTPRLAPVGNDKASFRLQTPIMPVWKFVRFVSRAAIDRPCESLYLFEVEQELTSVTPCAISDVVTTTSSAFLFGEDGIKIAIVSDFHRYGAEHHVTVGNLNATFVVNAVFTLSDGKQRLMPQIPGFEATRDEVRIIQLQFLAYLFTVYRRATKDKSITVDNLNRLEPKFEELPGRNVEVLNIAGVSVEAASKRYSIEVEGMLPYGPKVLQYAQQFFRSSAAVVVSDPDESDLFVREGQVLPGHAIMWKEEGRSLNWLSLGLTSSLAVIILTGLRVILKPTATADIAAVVVKRAVGADLSRGPMEVAHEEADVFIVKPDFDDRDEPLVRFRGTVGRNVYRFGAETQDPMEWMDREYEDSRDEDRGT